MGVFESFATFLEEQMEVLGTDELYFDREAFETRTQDIINMPVPPRLDLEDSDVLLDPDIHAEFGEWLALWMSACQEFGVDPQYAVVCYMQELIAEAESE